MASIPSRSFTDPTGQEFLIRTPRGEDAAAMLAYIGPVAGETEFFIVEPDEFPAEDEERKWIQDHLDHPGKLLLLAEASGTIIGSLSFENGRYRRIAHRGSFGIGVRKEWRGRGVGTALLRTLLEWAEANPIIEKVGLEVFATNERAIRLYKKLGFVEQGFGGKEVKRGPGEYVDVVWMYRFVKQV